MAIFNDFSGGKAVRVAHAPHHLPESDGMAHEHVPVEFPPMTHLAGKGFHAPGHVAMPKHVSGHRGTPRLRNSQPPVSV